MQAATKTVCEHEFNHHQMASQCVPPPQFILISDGDCAAAVEQNLWDGMEGLETKETNFKTATQCGNMMSQHHPEKVSATGKISETAACMPQCQSGEEDLRVLLRHNTPGKIPKTAAHLCVCSTCRNSQRTFCWQHASCQQRGRSPRQTNPCVDSMRCMISGKDPLNGDPLNGASVNINLDHHHMVSWCVLTLRFVLILDSECGLSINPPCPPRDCSQQPLQN